MKAKKKDILKSTKITESALIASVAEKLRYKVLFPEKVEEARKYISAIKASPF